MGSGLFGIGISGLGAAQAGLVTTGHNIANASTPGFHRQEVVQSNTPGFLTGRGYIGRGVETDTIRRVYNSFLEDQASRAQAQSSYHSTYSSQVGQIDTLLSDPSAGLAPELQRFFAGVNEVAVNPSSATARQSMLAAGESLVARVQSLDSRIVEMNSGVNVQIESTVSRVNSYAREIAALNGRIAEMQGNVQQPPNDLLDQRERMISELNALVGSTTLAQSNGTLSVSFGTGQPLVIGEQAFRVEAAASPDTPQRLDVNYVTGSGSTLLAPQAIGGSLGALLASSCWGGMRVHAGRRADTVSVDGADIRSDSNLGLGAALVGGTPRDRQDYRHSAERKKAEKAGF